MPTLVRRDVYSLAGPWHPVLRAYALAIGVMRDLPESDPCSLAYQAAVHGVFPAPNPPDGFRNQCQHNCWYFLPWHRWYLYYFEQVVRSILPTIAEVPAEVAQAWALPYWNYDRPQTRTLPPEFGSESLWDGRLNPLYDPTRNPGVNLRLVGVDPRLAVPGRGVLQLPFSSAFATAATFGGTESAWQHFNESGGRAGGLESTPHNAVHGLVGGNMGAFETAGLDPVFWLHHCNMDRYWEVKQHQSDPTGWTVTFAFRTPGPSPTVQVTAAGCVDTVGQLAYEYDDVNPPAAVGAQAVGAVRGEVMPEAPVPDVPPEVVGTRGAVRLAGQRVDAPMEVGTVSARFEAVRGGEAEPQRVYLTVNDIRGEVNPGISYGVYLGGIADDEHLAGLVSFFGIEATARGEHGLGYTFDVTDVVNTMRNHDDWDPADVHVVFEPVGGVDDEGNQVVPEVPPVEVGSISIAYQ